jgi:lipopolysaccharide/colanic/teichoic acid biosynthesis glycosyltransferase
MAVIRDPGGIRCCRMCDVLIACLAVALFLPLMTAVAFAIKADSGGPVLSRRVRICRNGRWIQTFEFRVTASRGSEATWVHRFLRDTRIDTLPEVIDVLRGDLTFIGHDRPGFVR